MLTSRDTTASFRASRLIPRSASQGADGAAGSGILVVDDHPAVRTELQRMLAGRADFVPVATAATPSEAIAQARLRPPTVAVVDYRLPGRDGLSLALELKRLPNPPRVAIYSAFTGARLTLGAIIAGLDGVAEKSAGAEALCAVIRAVATGSRVMPALSERALSAAAAGLAAEDLAIGRMLVNGASPDEVADLLGISPSWLEVRRWAIVRHLVALEERRRGFRFG